MSKKFVISALTLAGYAIAGVAAAQSFVLGNLVSVSSASATTTPSAGASQVTLGSINVAALQSGEGGTVQLSSIPITITASNNASPAHLTACQLYNSNGASVTSNNQVNPSGTSQSYIFNAPLTVFGGTSQTLTLRCNVSIATPAGGSFTFTAGLPDIVSSLGVTLSSASSVARGQQDAVLATITLSAARSNRDINVSSVPISINFGNGMNSGLLSDCRIRAASNPNEWLSSNLLPGTVASGLNAFQLASTQTIPAGSTFTFTFTCDVNASSPNNGTIDLAIPLGNFEALFSGTNEKASVVRGNIPGTNTPGNISGTVRVSPTPTTPTPPQPTIPGVPNTGLGGDWSTIIVLAISGLLVIGGTRYLMRRRY